ncbi:hypothetical protein [Celerinatantimonas sp. MCCC 1A17872]|uniref:hypothetical protein n=1 Tax=Celerinatantimonas sp. MCCC 1A17872 TaxID=3177514 RepID=UPI0038C46A5D
MLILKKPTPDELEVVIQIRAECCNCGQQALVEAPSTEAAAIKLQRLGWHSFETDEICGTNFCPNCIHELKEIEQQESAA